jgi:hypothetical protein
VRQCNGCDLQNHFADADARLFQTLEFGGGGFIELQIIKTDV